MKYSAELARFRENEIVVMPKIDLVTIEWHVAMK